MKSKWWIVCICILISLVIGVVPLDKEFSFQRTFSFLSFFMTGKYCRFKSLKDFRFVSKVTAGLIISSLIICIIFVPFDLSVFLYGQISLWHIAHHLYSSITIKVFYFFVAFVMSMSVAALIPAINIRWLSCIGRKTLYIYLYHTLILSIVNKYLDMSGPIEFVYLGLIEVLALTALYKIPLVGDLVDVKKIGNALKKIIQ